MANHEIKNPPIYSADLRKMETTDKAHADAFNPLYEQLINNDAFLKVKADAADSHAANAAIHVTETQKQGWEGKAPNVLASGSQNGLLSKEDKTKLDTVTSGAKPNQNALSSIKVGGTTVTANAESTQVELVAGSNISLAADNSTKKVTVSANMPSSLPANGGNADTIGGHSESHFVRTRDYAGIDVSSPSYPYPYMTAVSGSAAMPNTDWWHVIYVPHNDSGAGYGCQIAISFYGIQDMYVRSANGGTWSAWKGICSSASMPVDVNSTAPGGDRLWAW